MATIDIKGREIIFDEEDRHIIESHKWFFTPQGYACTKIRYLPGKKGRRTIGMHRLILGDPSTPSIDHINRIKLDNRKENLRPCTDSQNNHNRPVARGKTSKYRGVSFKRGKWQVVIRVNGRLTWFGYHATEEAAGAIAAPYFADIAA